MLPGKQVAGERIGIYRGMQDFLTTLPEIFSGRILMDNKLEGPSDRLTWSIYIFFLQIKLGIYVDIVECKENKVR